MTGAISYHPYGSAAYPYQLNDPAYRKNATRDATATLKAWLNEHRKNPYQETRVATREESGVLGFPSRRGLTPRGSLECNPEIPAFPGEEN